MWHGIGNHGERSLCISCGCMRNLKRFGSVSCITRRLTDKASQGSMQAVHTGKTGMRDAFEAQNTKAERGEKNRSMLERGGLNSFDEAVSISRRAAMDSGPSMKFKYTNSMHFSHTLLKTLPPMKPRYLEVMATGACPFTLFGLLPLEKVSKSRNMGDMRRQA